MARWTSLVRDGCVVATGYAIAALERGGLHGGDSIDGLKNTRGDGCGSRKADTAGVSRLVVVVRVIRVCRADEILWAKRGRAGRAPCRGCFFSVFSALWLWVNGVSFVECEI